MTTATHTDAPWDSEGLTTLYAAPDEADAITMIEIRANVTEAGWDTVAFIEAIWPNARANARLIKAAPDLLAALEAYVDYDDEPRGRLYEDIRLAARDAIAIATEDNPQILAKGTRP